jgi:hypothetical protein
VIEDSGLEDRPTDIYSMYIEDKMDCDFLLTIRETSPTIWNIYPAYINRIRIGQFDAPIAIRFNGSIIDD